MPNPQAGWSTLPLTFTNCARTFFTQVTNRSVRLTPRETPMPALRNTAGNCDCKHPWQASPQAREKQRITAGHFVVSD